MLANLKDITLSKSKSSANKSRVLLMVTILAKTVGGVSVASAVGDVKEKTLCWTEVVVGLAINLVVKVMCLVVSGVVVVAILSG